MATATNQTRARQTQFQTKVSAELWLNLGGKEYRLVGRTIRIGRAEDNDIVVDHKSCSRYHAVITLSGSKIIFEDLKSRNGIYVNRTKVRRAELKDNDAIRIGDIYGIFFQVERSQSKVLPSNWAANFEQITPLIEKWKSKIQPSQFSQLDKQKKLLMVAAGTMSLLALMFLFSQPGSQPMIGASTAAAPIFNEIVDTPVDRAAFEGCLEKEDLGSFNQAQSCFLELPMTKEVAASLERIQRRQTELTEKRFVEGNQAFDNYHYEMAILKWQEVLLVANESSEFRLKAMKGIQEAEQRQRLQ